MLFRPCKKGQVYQLGRRWAHERMQKRLRRPRMENTVVARTPTGRCVEVIDYQPWFIGTLRKCIFLRKMNVNRSIAYSHVYSNFFFLILFWVGEKGRDDRFSTMNCRECVEHGKLMDATVREGFRMVIARLPETQAIWGTHWQLCYLLDGSPLPLDFLSHMKAAHRNHLGLSSLQCAPSCRSSSCSGSLGHGLGWEHLGKLFAWARNRSSFNDSYLVTAGQTFSVASGARSAQVLLPKNAASLCEHLLMYLRTRALLINKAGRGGNQGEVKQVEGKSPRKSQGWQRWHTWRHQSCTPSTLWSLLHY